MIKQPKTPEQEQWIVGLCDKFHITALAFKHPRSDLVLAVLATAKELYRESPRYIREMYTVACEVRLADISIEEIEAGKALGIL